MPRGLSTAHAPSVVRWLLNLAAHPVSARWLGSDPARFAAFYTVLKPRLEMPEAVVAALPSRDGEMNIRLRESQFEQWRNSDSQPLRGQVPPAYREAFWEGTVLADWARENPQAWAAAVAQMANCHAALAADSDKPLSEFANKLKDAPSLCSIEMPGKDSTPTSLLRLNLMVWCSAVTTLDPEEAQLVEMAFNQAEDDALRIFFDLLSDNPRLHAEMMSIMMDITTEKWHELVSDEADLSVIGLVSFDPTTRRVQPMHPFWHEWLGSLHASASDAFAKIIVPLRQTRTAGALGRVAPDQAQMIRKILVDGAGMPATNVLLYGARSIDKLGWVSEQAKACDKKAYTLPSTVLDPVLPSVCFCAQRLIARLYPQDCWLVLPNADKVLTRTHRGRRQFLFMELEINEDRPDNAREAVLINENPVPTVWLVHSPDRISEDNIGRFLYTCEIKAASRAERRVEIEHILGPLRLSSEFITDLSQHLRLSRQQLESAAELVHRFHDCPSADQPHLGQAAREETARAAIEQSQKALNRRQREDLRQPITQYSLDLLNLHGAFSIDQVISSLRKRPNASLCFYGLPGTGKTQLAEHIAVELDKPILIKRASDILGKFVGENEKNLREMFEEAADEDAVLLLDEADSFLRDRTMARQSWEVSTVNELLQGMERHRGVFICTTNLFQHLDLASLRRFTFKLEFLELDESQRWRMFCNESGFDPSGHDDELVESLKLDILGIRGLAPGDFATIQRQVHLLDQKLGPKQWVQALRAEVQAKMREASITNAIGTQTL